MEPYKKRLLFQVHCFDENLFLPQDEKEEKGKDKKEDSKKRTASGRGSRKGDKEKKDAAAAEGEEKDGAGQIQEPPQPERYYPVRDPADEGKYYVM